MYTHAHTHTHAYYVLLFYDSFYEEKQTHEIGESGSWRGGLPLFVSIPL